MKEAIGSLLQQRMDRCGSEQLWAVGAITGFNGLLVTQSTAIVSALPRWVPLIAVIAASAYAVYYIVYRHKMYYLYQAALAGLLQDYQECPEVLKKAKNPRDPRTCTGSAFYVLWVVGMGAFGTLALMPYA